MTSLKFILIASFVIINVTSGYNIDATIANAVKDIVLGKKSNTCVILVIEGKVKFITAEAQAPTELAKRRHVISKINLLLIKSSFRPRTPKDVLEKLAKIAKVHSSFLVHFSVPDHKSVKGSITNETTKPVGLIGKLLASLGLRVEDRGLLPLVLSVLGINPNKKDIEIIEFEY